MTRRVSLGIKYGVGSVYLSSRVPVMIRVFLVHQDLLGVDAADCTL